MRRGKLEICTLFAMHIVSYTGLPDAAWCCMSTTIKNAFLTKLPCLMFQTAKFSRAAVMSSLPEAS
jgi:hypothetical protein